MAEHRIEITGTEELEQVFAMAERFAAENRLGKKDGLHLRLIAEELLELRGFFGEGRQGVLSLAGDREKSVISLSLTGKPAGTEASIDRLSECRGVSDKIRFLMACSFDTLEAAGEETAAIGVQKQTAEELADSGLKLDADAYVWTMDTYSLSSFDRYADTGEVDWPEISRSIIANLVDDVRIFILPDRTELKIYLSFGKMRVVVKEKYAIHPDFQMLCRIPVAKTGFQIRLVQLMYGQLPYKQESTEEYAVFRHSMLCKSAPEGFVSVLEYVPRALEEKKDSPAVLFPHGGAFLFPALPYHYRLAAEAAVRVGCRVFMPLYDLGPKHILPLPIRECYDVYKSLLNASRLRKIDPDRTAVMGDSSGGTIAAAICLLSRDEGIRTPAAQLLLYPSLDGRGETGSMKKYPDVPVVNAEAIRIYKRILRVDEAECIKWYNSPMEADSFAELSPAYIETAEFDALHDEGVEYARKLKKAGCSVTLNETRGTVHSFDMAKDSPVFLDALDKRIGFLRQALH